MFNFEAFFDALQYIFSVYILVTPTLTVVSPITHFIEEKCRSTSHRCGACENCIKADCGMCKFCKDKP